MVKNSVYHDNSPIGALAQQTPIQEDLYDADEDTLVTAAVDAVTKSTVNQTDKTLFAGVRGSVAILGCPIYYRSEAKC